METKRVKPGSLRDHVLRRECVSRVLLAVVTFSLISFLALQSSELHDADTALKEYQQLVSEHPQEKVYLAWRMYYYERVLDTKGPPLNHLDEYQRLIDTLHEHSAKHRAIARLLHKASVFHWRPPDADPIEETGVAAEAPRLRARQAVAGMMDLPSQEAYLGQSGKPPTSPSTHECTDSRPSVMTSGTSAGAGALEAEPSLATTGRVKAYVEAIECFLAFQKIPAAPPEVLWASIYDVRSKVQMLTGWLLPGLYGMLGACVFLMRDRLGVGRPVVVRAHVTLAQVSMFMRVALGGLAGVIIGWYSVPNAGGGGGDPVLQVSSLPFGLAFLAGFSIETLFSMLDRFNEMIQSREK